MRDGTVIVFELATLQARFTIGKQLIQKGILAPDTSGTRIGTGLSRSYGVPGDDQFGPSLVFSPNGKSLIQAGLDQAVHLWDLATGVEMAAFKGHTGPLTAVAYSPDGKSVASASWDTTALIWDVSNVDYPRATAKMLTPDKLDSCWQTLSGNDAAKAFAAISDLAASPKEAVTLIKQQIKPALPVDLKRIDELMAQLDSDKFKVRDQANRELLKIGERIHPALKRTFGEPQARNSKATGRHSQKTSLRLPCKATACEPIALVGSAGTHRHPT